MDAQLYTAVIKCNADEVDRLLRKGANPDGFLGPHKGRALHWAASTGHQHIAQLLLEAGAQVCPRDKSNITPYHMAWVKGHKDVAQLLQAAGSDTKQPSFGQRLAINCSSWYAKGLSLTWAWMKGGDQRQSTSDSGREVPPKSLNNILDSMNEGLSKTVSFMVHRENIIEDMITFYQDPNVTKYRLEVSFFGERGIDEGGLTRDLFATFWQKLLEEFFYGENAKVPKVAPNKLAKAEDLFAVLGRILSHGMVLTQSLPPLLSKAFLLSACCPHIQTSKQLVLEDFLKHVPHKDSLVMQRALQTTGHFDDIITERLLTIFDQYGMQVLPKPSTLQANLEQMGRTEILLKPAHFATLMQKGIPDHYKDSLWGEVTEDTLAAFYKELEPIPDKVLTMMITEKEEGELQEKERVVFAWLQQYILGLNNAMLAAFLHFVTGSQTLPQSLITVTFSDEDGFAGMPKASTCSYMLCLSIKYRSYSALKEEFNHLLTSSEAFEMLLL